VSEPSQETPAPDARLDAAEGRATSPEAAERAERADADYARRLRDALAGLGMLGTLAAPHTHNQLLELIVRNAMQVTSARMGTLRLIDRGTNELVFEVIQSAEPAQHERLEAARQVRVSLGQGIAGWVAASGQPVVRSDLAEDARFTAEATERFGVAPKSMLCLPVQGDEGTLGVIELFDKAGDEPFTARDMDVLGLFGQAAAAAIAQSQVLNDVTRLFGFMLQRLLGDTPDAVLLQDHASELVDRVVQASDFRDAIQIAVTAGQIARQGPDARRLCLGVLDNVADYLRGQRNRATLGGRLT